MIYAKDVRVRLIYAKASIDYYPVSHHAINLQVKTTVHKPGNFTDGKIVAKEIKPKKIAGGEDS